MRLASLNNTREQLNLAWWRPDSKIAPISSTATTGVLHKEGLSLLVARHGAACFALLVGTGGLSTSSYITARDQHGYPFPKFEHPIKRKADMDIPTAARNLSRVKAVFAPSVTELASLFNVSRQTIYNWQAGEPIATENRQRLEQLTEAANLFDAHGLSQKVGVLRRPISGGKNFFELVKAGSDPTEICRKIIANVEVEMEQRQRLQDRLANRKRKPLDVDEIGSPHLDELA
jgi:transcriptional regulator with XRE-family HTH domain